MLSTYMSIFASAVYVHPAELIHLQRKHQNLFYFTVELFSASGSSYEMERKTARNINHVINFSGLVATTLNYYMLSPLVALLDGQLL